MFHFEIFYIQYTVLYLYKQARRKRNCTSMYISYLHIIVHRSVMVVCGAECCIHTFIYICINNCWNGSAAALRPLKNRPKREIFL
jgi:hypothetical protein